MTLNAGQLDQFKCRQALEALRNGVPNNAAVELLGCNQPAVICAFDDLLLQAVDADTIPGGVLSLLVTGDFGSGKSHLLSYLEHRALSQGFACSRVAISKETPLYNLSPVFTAAVQHTRLPGRTGQLMEEMADKINARTPEYERFSHWLNRTDNGLHPYFPATVMIYERLADFGLRSAIEAFWAGDPINASSVKGGLRAIGHQFSFGNFRAPLRRDLPPQRLRFATELIKGAGYNGWVVLLDELELVGYYSLLQRARSYAELARWLGKTTDERYPGLIVIGAFTRGFEAEVLGLDGKNDWFNAPNRLRERSEPGPAARAESAIQALENEYVELASLNETELRGTLENLRQLYSRAYDWDAPAPARQLGGTSQDNEMRHIIRACINEWDLQRIYPYALPETQVQQFEHHYEEQKEMEQQVRDDE